MRHYKKKSWEPTVGCISTLFFGQFLDADFRPKLTPQYNELIRYKIDTLIGVGPSSWLGKHISLHIYTIIDNRYNIINANFLPKRLTFYSFRKNLSSLASLKSRSCPTPFFFFFSRNLTFQFPVAHLQKNETHSQDNG